MENDPVMAVHFIGSDITRLLTCAQVKQRRKFESSSWAPPPDPREWEEWLPGGEEMFKKYMGW